MLSFFVTNLNKDYFYVFSDMTMKTWERDQILTETPCLTFMGKVVNKNIAKGTEI